MARTHYLNRARSDIRPPISETLAPLPAKSAIPHGRDEYPPACVTHWIPSMEHS
jgi:hypothetical protein